MTARTMCAAPNVLLAQDPANRVPMTWEVMHPWPPPERATYETDPRIAQWEREIARTHGSEVPDFAAGVWLGDQRLVTAHFRGRSVKPVLARTSMRDLQRVAGLAARELIIGKRGRGTLYYVARLRYARRALPSAPRDHGFAVNKKIPPQFHYTELRQ